MFYLGLDSFAAYCIAVTFAHWNFLFLSLKTMKNIGTGTAIAIQVGYKLIHTSQHQKD